MLLTNLFLMYSIFLDYKNKISVIFIFLFYLILFHFKISYSNTFDELPP